MVVDPNDIITDQFAEITKILKTFTLMFVAILMVVALPTFAQSGDDADYKVTLKDIRPIDNLIGPANDNVFRVGVMNDGNKPVVLPTNFVCVGYPSLGKIGVWVKFETVDRHYVKRGVAYNRYRFSKVLNVFRGADGKALIDMHPQMTPMKILKNETIKIDCRYHLLRLEDNHKEYVADFQMSLSADDVGRFKTSW